MYNEEILKGKIEFNKDTLEKVLRLVEILEYKNSDSTLSKHLVLKGGTAINLLADAMPRLSVDIDWDFCLNCSRDEMLEKRNIITNKITAYMEGNNYHLEDKTKNVAALDSMVFSYINAAGNKDVIKIEINYLMRCHIFDEEKNIKYIDVAQKEAELVTLNRVELYGAKIKALIERGAARDLFDTANMIKNNVIDESEKELLKKCFIFYLTVGWSKELYEINISFEKIDKIQLDDVKRKLLPVLKKGTYYDLESDKKLVKDYLTKLLVLDDAEKEYIDNFRQGKYMPELLFDDKIILDRIKNHPMALWKTR